MGPKRKGRGIKEDASLQKKIETMHFQEVMKEEAHKLREKKQEDAEKIKQSLKGNPLMERINIGAKKIKAPAPIIWIPIFLGILTHFVCCFSLGNENDCCGVILWEDDTKLISAPPVKEKLTELATVFQKDETQDDLLMFWIPLLLGVLIGLLLIGGIIAGFVKWMMYLTQNNQTLLGINNEGKWVYGTKLQDKAALTANEGKDLPTRETK